MPGKRAHRRAGRGRAAAPAVSSAAAAASRCSASVSVWAGRACRDCGCARSTSRCCAATESLAVVGMPEPQPDDAVAVLLADPYSFPSTPSSSRPTTAARLAARRRPRVRAEGAGSTRLFRRRRVARPRRGGRRASRRRHAPGCRQHVVSQGCRPVGPAMTVTAAEGNVLLGLAGAPALEKLEEVARGRCRRTSRRSRSPGCSSASRWTSTPTSTAAGDFLVRGVAGADPERGGLAVGDVVEVGRTVRLQVRDAASGGRRPARAASPTSAGRGARSGRGRAAVLLHRPGCGAVPGSADHDVARGARRAGRAAGQRVLRGRRDRSRRRSQPPARLHRVDPGLRPVAIRRVP